jgi:hypothetical protein
MSNFNLCCVVLACVVLNILIVVTCGYSPRGQTGRTHRHGIP